MPRAERICFVTGFGRSGTTVLTEAIADALSAPVLTVGDLARHRPALAALLATLQSRSVVLDRGIDARPVSSAMAEEYGFYLGWQGKIPRPRYHARAKADLQALADRVAARGTSGSAVMKNPLDTTNEARLLKDFPNASVVIVRRTLPEIEASITAGVLRAPASGEYLAALVGGTLTERFNRFAQRGARSQRLVLAMTVWGLRLNALRLARAVARLPAERTALLSYDEFKTDPHAAAQWAAHLLDADVLSREFSARCQSFSGGHQGARGSRITRAIDRYWAKSWERARAEHAIARNLSQRNADGVGAGSTGHEQGGVRPDIALARSSLRGVVSFSASSRLLVIVPAYNEEHSIRSTLNSLAGQADMAFTLLVVDNNSTDQTVAIVRDFAQAHPQLDVRLEHEEQKGTGAAADTGMRAAIAAGATHLARTDADCMPAPDWTLQVKRAFDDGLQLVSGRLLPRTDEFKLRRWERVVLPRVTGLDMFFGGLHPTNRDPSYLGPYMRCTGCNMAITAELYERGGGFPRACIEEVHEDTALFRCVRKISRDYGYRRDMRVYESIRRLRAYGPRNTIRWYNDHGYHPEVVDIR